MEFDLNALIKELKDVVGLRVPADKMSDPLTKAQYLDFVEQLEKGLRRLIGEMSGKIETIEEKIENL